MKLKILGLLAVALLVGPMVASATLVTFTATGSPDVSGFVQFDDSTFGSGTFDPVNNTAITALSLNVLSHSFTLADVNTAGLTYVDASGVAPLIVNGGGALAFNGVQYILFFPDGAGGTVMDGDASLALDTDGNLGTPESVFAVRWMTVPEPGTLALLGLGLAGLGLSRRRKAN